MRNLIFIIGAGLIFTSCKQTPKSDTNTGTTVATESTKSADAPMGMYGLKSAILETETLMPGGMGSNTMKIIIDDYGKQRMTEMTMAMSMGGHSMNTTSKTLIKEDYVYSWTGMSKTGTKFKLDPNKLDKKNLDFSKLTEEMKAKMKVKDEGTESIEGRECKVVSYETDAMKGKMWLYKQLPLQSEMMMGDKKIITKLKSLDENPSLPAGTFDLPADIQFKELNFPGHSDM